MVGVAWRGNEVEAFIEGFGFIVFRVNRKSPNAGDVRGLQSTEHGVLEEPAADAFTLPRSRNGEAGQQHDGHWMTRQAFGQPFGRIVIFHLANHERVVASHSLIRDCQIGLRCFGLLTVRGAAAAI